jgi:ribonuclease P protein subunit POP4
MTPLTAETLPRHELVGLAVRVRAADNPDLVGVEGEVVAETAETLTVEGSGRERQVPKEGTTFAFDLPAGNRDGPGDAGSARVVVDGERLVARPARRTETTGDNTWR